MNPSKRKEAWDNFVCALAALAILAAVLGYCALYAWTTETTP